MTGGPKNSDERSEKLGHLSLHTAVKIRNSAAPVRRFVETRKHADLQQLRAGKSHGGGVAICSAGLKEAKNAARLSNARISVPPHHASHSSHSTRGSRLVPNISAFFRWITQYDFLHKQSILAEESSLAMSCIYLRGYSPLTSPATVLATKCESPTRQH